MPSRETRAELQQTLKALRQTSKGSLKYNDTSILDASDGSRTRVSEEREGKPCASLHTASPARGISHRATFQRLVSEERLLTVNTLYDDDSECSSDDETTPEDFSPSRQYYLDEDNSQANISLSPESVSTGAGQREQMSALESLSSSSIEEVARRDLDAVYIRECQERASERQMAYIEGLNQIHDEFRQRFDELSLDEELRCSERAQERELMFEESTMIFQDKIEELKLKGRENMEALNVMLETLQEETKKKLEKQAHEDQLMNAREAEKQQRVRSECRELALEVNKVAAGVMEKLNSDVLSETTASEDFVNTGKKMVEETMGKVHWVLERPSVESVAKIKIYLKNLNILTVRVDKQQEITKKIQLKRMQEEMRHSQMERQRQQTQKLEQQRLQKVEHQRQQQLEHQRQQEVEQQRLRKLEHQRQQQLKHQRQQQLEQQRQQETRSKQSEPNHSVPSSKPAQGHERMLSPKPLSDMCCHEDTWVELLRLHEVVRVGQEAGKSLSANPQHKKLKLELQKAISITINAISAFSGQQLKEKLKTLNRLIEGEKVSVGNSTVSTHRLPTAALFCQNLIAKKLVEQADSQVSSNAKAAFPFAVIMVSLMNDSKEMKDLVLGYFYIQCPYLLPYYPIRKEGASTEQYFSDLGYKVSTSGEIEGQDLFIKRMTGYSKLFASCMSSYAVNGMENLSLDMTNAWMLLVRLVNLKPRPATTATIISSVLNVCGCRLIGLYGPQAKKLLVFLLEQFLPLIREANEETESVSDGGATERLEQTLQELLSRRTLQNPEGYINKSFWYS